MKPKKHRLCWQLRVHLVDSEPEIWRRLLVPFDSTLFDLHLILQDAFQWDNYHLHGFEVWDDGRLISAAHRIDAQDYEITLKMIEEKAARREVLDENEQQILDIKNQLAANGIEMNREFLTAYRQSLLFNMDVDIEQENAIADGMVLSAVMDVGDALLYTYDFGDNWEHLILCEGLIICPPRARLPSCIDGGGNHAFEDIGGIYGYMHALEILKNPQTEDDKEMVEWLVEGHGRGIRKHDPAAFDIKKIKFQHYKK